VRASPGSTAPDEARSLALGPAPGDQWAWVGRDFSNHAVNPAADALGADVCGVDTGVGGASVTDHESSTGSGTGYLDGDTESLRHVALATAAQGDEVADPVEREPTLFQQALIEGMRGAY